MFGASKNSADQNDKDVMTVRTGYPYQTLKIRSGDGTLVMDLWIVYVPLDAAQRTNRTFGLLSIRKPGIPFARTGTAAAGLVHGAHLQGRPLDRRARTRGPRQAGSRLEPEVFPVINELRDLLRHCGGRTVIPIREVSGAA